MIKKYPSNHPTRLTKGYNHYSVQGCKQEIDMTDKLKEEINALQQEVARGHVYEWKYSLEFTVI